jgi:hypothetical protein
MINKLNQVEDCLSICLSLCSIYIGIPFIFLNSSYLENWDHIKNETYSPNVNTRKYM